MLLKSKEIAYLGVLLGLNQLFIILSSVIETNTIILMSAAALIIGVVIVEFKLLHGIIFYYASCILGFILTFNKIEIFTYIIFFGSYSLVKHLIESKVINRITQYTLKFIYFNIALLILYFIVHLYIVLELTWWMVVAGEVLFLIYDYAFTIFINTYIEKIKPKLKK